MIRITRIQDPKELRFIHDLIHDCFFDVDDLVFDKATGVLSFGFVRPMPQNRLLGLENFFNTGKKLKGLQTGGPLGGFLPASSADMPIVCDGMIAAGAMFGSGGIIVGDETVDVVDMARLLAEFNAEESCGKCFPCRIGTRQMARILERLAHKQSTDRELQAAMVIGDTMKSSLCAHGQLADNPIKSGYRYFKDEFRARLK